MGAVCGDADGSRSRRGIDFATLHLPGKETMKRLALALLVSSFAVGGAAADPTCHDRAAEKKLAGAALSSFMKKCELRHSGLMRPRCG